MSEDVKGTYGAVDLDVHQRVATKKSLDVTETQPFLRELFSLCALKHIPQVITLKHFSYTDRTLVLGLGQETLSQLIDRRLEVQADWGYSREAVSLMWQLAVGMKRINDAGVWHRDLKPDNIVMDADSSLKIIDFGLARVGAFATTETTSTVYTTWWRAPELLVANVLGIEEYKYDGRAAEIYAIGSTFLCVLLGNSHGLLQNNHELTQLQEIVQLEDGCDLYSPSTFDEHDVNWRKVLVGKLLKHRKRRRTQRSMGEIVRRRLPGVPVTVVSLLTGLLHPNWQSRFDYQTILQHEFFDSVRIPYDQPLPRPWPSGVLKVACAATYQRVLVNLALWAGLLNMSSESRLHMLALVDLVASHRAGSPDQLHTLAYSCLLVADALHAKEPIEVCALATDVGLSVELLEDSVQVVIQMLQDCLPTTCLPESTLTAWAGHPLRPQLLQCYFTLAASGARLSRSVEAMERSCVKMCKG